MLRPMCAQVAAGRSCYVHDAGTGAAVRQLDGGCAREVLHSPRVEGTRDGRLAFIGNADGALLAYDLRRARRRPSDSDVLFSSWRTFPGRCGHVRHSATLDSPSFQG
jgi:hypothetical protein